jgi:hypothetical protein
MGQSHLSGHIFHAVQGDRAPRRTERYGLLGASLHDSHRISYVGPPLPLHSSPCS